LTVSFFFSGDCHAFSGTAGKTIFHRAEHDSASAALLGGAIDMDTIAMEKLPRIVKPCCIAPKRISRKV
jgi:hypothetical protein